MRLYLARAVDRLRASYWFVPSLMAVGALVLGVSTERIDQAWDFEPEALSWIYGGGPEGARAVLSTIAGSMITVAGVAFSITMVVLVLASSQFGPRILGNFMRDRGNQYVLGTFIATFLYCLVVLRTVRGQEASAFVPQVSVTLGVALGLISVGVFIYFIDHVATSIQAPSVVSRVGRDLDALIERRFPSDAAADVVGQPRGTLGQRPIERSGAIRVESDHAGYVQYIDLDGLVKAAAQSDTEVRCCAGVGDYVLPGSPLVEAPGIDEDTADRIRRKFALGDRRSSTGDVQFITLQLVEIAVRALSPGINDPFTAINCIDRLGAALSHVASAPAAPETLSDDDGQVRVEVRPLGFPEMLDTAFDQIRAYGADAPSVLLRLLETFALIGARARRAEDRRALAGHAERVLEAAEGLLPADRERVESAYRRLATAEA